MKQYLHFPKGNGSYTVAENLARNANTKLWAIGDYSSGLYIDGTFPVLFSHPKSSGKRFADLSQPEYWEYYNNLSKALASEPKDLAIVHHGFAIAKILGKKQPVVSYLHGTEMLAFKHVPEYIKQDVYDGLSLSKKVLVMSEKQKDMALDMFQHVLRCDVEVLSGGIDTDIFHPYDTLTKIKQLYSLNPDKKMILFAGRLTTEKNLDVLVDAFDTEFSSDKQLVIVGSGSRSGDLSSYARDKDVHFISALPQKELAQLMSAADVFVLPSTYESFGLVVLEAIASGTPVVASDVGILKQLIDPPNGGEVFSLNNSSVDNLKSSIDKALCLDTQTFKEYSYSIRSGYSWEGVAKRFVHLVKNI
ncbi:MAG: glycosyltransferase family 4 protein [Nanoarchaeota archaeon]|nr:glycosyltransferase family 4 protein [Nanoarchaeota archaeon]